tara:strand:- start:49 stop:696 length:648 start_codon:yes stop_codon:yes gene_type:complete
MIIPFIPEDLFQLNENLHPQFDGEVIIVDNIFKNYQNILDVCNNTSVENWKISPTSRNFKDYYDCSPIIQNHFPNVKMNNRLGNLISLTKHFFKEKGNIISDKEFIFNYFKHLKKDVSNNIQHYPHYDEYFNVICYIDPFENGGTNLYENANLENKEKENLLFNISNFKIKKQIKAKPNRCVIFPGHNLHGGYIKNHNIYYYNWRINLVNFLKIQ